MDEHEPAALMAQIVNGDGEPILVGRLSEALPAGSIIAVGRPSGRGQDPRWHLAIVPECFGTEAKFSWLEQYGVRS